MLQSVFMISVGASCGAILRWLLGLALNNTFQHGRSHDAAASG